MCLKKKTLIVLQTTGGGVKVKRNTSVSSDIFYVYCYRFKGCANRGLRLKWPLHLCFAGNMFMRSRIATSDVKFHVKLGKSPTKTYALLKEGYEDEKRSVKYLGC